MKTPVKHVLETKQLQVISVLPSHSVHEAIEKLVENNIPLVMKGR